MLSMAIGTFDNLAINFAHSIFFSSFAKNAEVSRMEKVCIKGYKSFQDITLELGQINILIGSNGSGKSNFLSFFEFLNKIYEQKMTEYVALNGGVDKFFHKGSKVTDVIQAEVFWKTNRYQIQLKEGDGRFVVAHEKLGYTAGSMVYYNDIANYTNEAGIKQYKGLKRGDYINNYLTEIKKYHFHDTGKTSPFTKESHIQNDRYYLYEKGDNLAAFLYAIQEETPIVYNRIVKVIQSIAPYFSDFYFHPTAANTLRLQWRDKYSSIVYGPTDFSDGTIRFIALATLFLQPTPPKVIIIDEPELGLHPVAIQKLAGMMHAAASKGTQIIVATQSTDLLCHFEPEEVITVNQVEGATQMVRLNSEELNHWLEDYTLGDLWKQNIVKGGQPE